MPPTNNFEYSSINRSRLRTERTSWIARTQNYKKIMKIKMNQNDEEIPALVEKLKGVLSLLDKDGYSLPAIKVEEAILALQQVEDLTENSDNNS
jgi:hypothetical protein